MFCSKMHCGKSVINVSVSGKNSQGGEMLKFKMRNLRRFAQSCDYTSLAPGIFRETPIKNLDTFF
jgi:hypothetical protein